MLFCGVLAPCCFVLLTRGHNSTQNSELTSWLAAGFMSAIFIPLQTELNNMNANACLACTYCSVMDGKVLLVVFSYQTHELFY